MNAAAAMLRTSEGQAYEAIRDLVLTGRLPLGEFLSQRGLAGETGTSVISVRTALRRLENEGLVENVPKWGVRIPVDTPARVRERYAVREVLELAALTWWRPSRNAALAAELARLADDCDAVAASQDDGRLPDFAVAHQAFHVFLVGSGGSELLVELWQRVTTLNFLVTNARRGWGRDPAYWHRTLVEHLLADDDAAAAEALRAHIHCGLNHELAALSATAP